MIIFYKNIKKNYDNVGLCLQSYLYRTMNDIEKMMDIKPTIRLDCSQRKFYISILSQWLWIVIVVYIHILLVAAEVKKRCDDEGNKIVLLHLYMGLFSSKTLI